MKIKCYAITNSFGNNLTGPRFYTNCFMRLMNLHSYLSLITWQNIGEGSQCTSPRTSFGLTEVEGEKNPCLKAAAASTFYRELTIKHLDPNLIRYPP